MRKSALLSQGVNSGAGRYYAAALARHGAHPDPEIRAAALRAGRSVGRWRYAGSVRASGCSASTSDEIVLRVPSRWHTCQRLPYPGMKSALRTAVLLLCLGLARGARADPPIVPPRLESSSNVAYPEGAQGDARVILVLTIDKDGVVRSVELESGDEPFASPAKRAAASFRFTPATREG